MDSFAYDENVFMSAISMMDGICESMAKVKSSAEDVKSCPDGYKYRGKVMEVCDSIPKSNSFISSYNDKMSKTASSLGAIGANSSTKESNFWDDITGAFTSSLGAWKSGIVDLLNGKGASGIIDACTKTGATNTVAFTSVLSGLLKIGEGIDDGRVFLNNVPILLGAKVYDLATGKNTAKKRFDKTLDFIRRDRVSELNKSFYEDTIIGRFINENSYLKYDSAGAKSIRKAAEVTGKVAAATAATILSGGVAAPVILGAFYGGGKGAEKYAQSVDRENGEKYDYKRASLKFAANAATGAVEWWGYGQIGSTALNGAKALSALKASGADLSVSSLISKIPKLSNMSLKEAMHFGNFKRILKTQLVSKNFMLPSAATTFDHAVNYVLGDETGAEAFKNIRREFLINLGFEIFGAGAQSISLSHAAQIDDILASDGYIDDIANYIRKYSSGKINKIELSDSIEKAAAKYAQASGLAGEEYNAWFKNFRDHTLPHTVEVADYVSTHAVAGVKQDEAILSALYHDLGMSGGVIKINKGMKQDLLKRGFTESEFDEIIKMTDKKGYVNLEKLHKYTKNADGTYREDISDFLAQIARDNHSPNSGVIIATSDFVPKDMDRDVIALVTSTHSKSSSGISDMTSKDEWIKAIDSLDERVKATKPDATFDAKRLKEMIEDETQFKRLQREAFLVRDADAMAAPVYKTINGEKYLMMQDGTYTKVVMKPLSTDQVPDAKYIESEGDFISDVRYNGKGEIVKDRVGSTTIDNERSRGVHAGEYNTGFDSKVTDNNYVGNITIIDPRLAPNRSVAAAFERVGETATFTNFDERKVVFNFPEYMKNSDGTNTKLMDWYQEEIKSQREDAVEKLARKLKNGKISKETYKKLDDWYNNNANFEIKIGE